MSRPGARFGIAWYVSRGAVGPCPSGCPGTRLDVAWVNVCVYWAFFGGLTIADIAPPAAIGVVALPDTDTVVALNIKCIKIKISVDY